MLGDAVEVCTTTVPLGSGETFTSQWVMSQFPDVMTSCQTDNTGTLYYDFSPDGIAVNTFPVAGFSIADGIHEFHTAVKGPRRFRIRLVNDTGAQTYLRLYTYFGVFRQGNAPLNQTMGADADASIVRSISSDIDLALGRFGGMIEDSKFGEVRDLDAADEATDVWAYGSDGIGGTPLKTFPSSAQSLFASSSSASDTDVDVTIQYVDATGAFGSVDINLNGQTPVDVGATAFDVNRAFESGATAALGNIYITTENSHTGGVPDDPTKVLAYVSAAYAQTQLAMFTVPTGVVMHMKQANVYIARASGAAGSAEIHLRVREFGSVWVVKRVWHVTTSIPVNQRLAGLVIPARANVVMRVNDVSDTNTNVTAEWQYDLVAV